MVLPDPVEHKLVGCQQAQALAVFYGMQWSYPGVELLRWEFIFKPKQTLLPERHFHFDIPPESIFVLNDCNQGGGVYTCRKKLSTPCLQPVEFGES
jgi:hypothetical protein